MKPIVCITGPTASGKTALSIALARALDAEIISCDSMQIYRGMDIGTAKPTMAERQGIPHHLLDVADPGEPFDAARYAALADAAIAGIHERGKRVVVCGGTGFYLKALLFGLHKTDSDPAVRARLQRMAETEGAEALHRCLAEADPAAAVRLHPNDVRRVVRALEVCEITGRPLSESHGQNIVARYPHHLFGLDCGDALYPRIDARVTGMISAGLPQEIEHLLEQNLPPDSTALQAIGYKELIPVLRDGAPLEAAISAIQQASRRYAKRQRTFFRPMIDMWFDTREDGVLENILAILDN